jgi:hypothetical protein
MLHDQFIYVSARCATCGVLYDVHVHVRTNIDVVEFRVQSGQQVCRRLFTPNTDITG